MKFGPLQLKFFNADDGAYSIVTEDERRKGQITLTEADGESDVAIAALGEGNIPRRAAQSRPIAVSILMSDGSEAKAPLTINFPKANGNELRIYRKASAGFSYMAGDVWFVFRRKRRMFVGSMTERAWRSIGRLDQDDDRYVELVEEAQLPTARPRQVRVLQYPRNPNLALTAFLRARFKCEFDPKHFLFTGRVTGMPFLEPHHLVPVSLQSRFIGEVLDHHDNIFALCPRCHRAIHHAERELVTDMMARLIDRRSEVCERLNLALPEILRLYNCEEII